MLDSPLRGGKLKLAALQVGPEALFPQGTQKPRTLHCTPASCTGESLLSCQESQILYQIAICYVAGTRRPTPYNAQRPSIPHCDCRRAPASPSKSKNSSLLTEERKEATGTTRTLQGVTYPAYPSLKDTIGAPGGKKPENTNYRGTRD
jgi:hypothetical protein